MMGLVALCKVALLAATLEAAVQPLETCGEAAECEEIELANPPESVGLARRTPLKRLFPSSPSVEPGAQGARRPRGMAATAAGHRLPGGLCAPMRC